MKKEMVAKVNSVAAEFRKVSDIQMADTTKRTIQENVLITQQLSKMSGKAMEIIKENEYLKQTEKDLTRRMEILEFSNQELTRRNISCHKLLKMLRDKAGETEAWSYRLEERAMRCSLLEQESNQAQEEVMAKGRLVTVCYIGIFMIIS